jgi:non-ribosomal peptide synthetase component E (peptide arylation enzyme)
MEKYHELLIGRINENIARLASKTAYTIGEQKINYAQMNSMANSIAAGIVKAINPEAM